MTRYTKVKVRISEGQKDKLKKAFESNCISITIRLTFSDLHGEYVIALSNSHLHRLVEAYDEKNGMTIKMSKNTIGVQHENSRRIFTSVSRIDSIPNRNCFTRIKTHWGFMRTGEHESTKINWRWVASQDGKWTVADRNWWIRAVLWTKKRKRIWNCRKRSLLDETRLAVWR